MQPTIVLCPTCQRKVKWIADNQFKPFCSERCKGADLGAWANEQYTIESSQDPDPGSGLLPEQPT
jgi:uncharacterized protein